jgi:hypothetical protein
MLRDNTRWDGFEDVLKTSISSLVIVVNSVDTYADSPNTCLSDRSVGNIHRA